MLSSRFAHVARRLNSTSSSLSTSFAHPSLNPCTISSLDTSSVCRRNFSSDRNAGMPHVHPTALYRGRQLESTLFGDMPEFPTVTPFGTLRHPALIYSSNSQRIVGCVGGENLSHGLLWFQLKEGKKHVCSECGQVFKLVNEHNYDEIREFPDIQSFRYFRWFRAICKKLSEKAPASVAQEPPKQEH